MAERTALERELLEKAARFLPGGYTGNLKMPDTTRFLVREGSGSRVRDVSGNEYIDWLMGSGPMVLGHAHPVVVEAVMQAVPMGSTFFATNERAILLGEELIRAVPCAEQVRYTTSGTDACFQCLRIARVFRGRDKILKFEGGYHGTSDYALMSVTPTGTDVFPRAVASSGGIPKAIGDAVVVAPFNDLEMTAGIIEEHQDDLAAVIIEPLQRVIAPVRGFLEGLREVTARFEIPLIFDEVVTGFRLAYGGAQEMYGVTPDLCAVGKIMGGGYPLGAVLGRADIMSCYDPDTAAPADFVNHIGTLNGNPIACAAGLATLGELRQEGVYERLRSIGGRLRQALVDTCHENDIAVQSSGDDTICDVFFADNPVRNYRDAVAADGQMMTRLNARLLEHGVLKSWPQKFYPSLVHTDTDLEQTFEVFSKVVPMLRE